MNHPTCVTEGLGDGEGDDDGGGGGGASMAWSHPGHRGCEQA